MFLPKPRMQQIVIIAACFHFHWNARFTAFSLFRLKVKSCRILFKPSPKPVKELKIIWYFYALYLNLTAIWNISILSCLLDLMLNCGNIKKFKNQVFSNVKNSGLTPLLPVVESNVFLAVASRDIFRNWILLV